MAPTVSSRKPCFSLAYVRCLRNRRVILNERLLAWCAVAYSSSLPPVACSYAATWTAVREVRWSLSVWTNLRKASSASGPRAPIRKSGGASSAAAMVMISLVTWYMGAAKSAAASFDPTGRAAAVEPFSVTPPQRR